MDPTSTNSIDETKNSNGARRTLRELITVSGSSGLIGAAVINKLMINARKRIEYGYGNSLLPSFIWRPIMTS